VKLKRGLFLLFFVAAVVATGIALQVRWERNRKIRAAFPPDVKLVLEKSDKFYLYALQPERLPEADLKTMPNFHGYPISGQARVRPTPQRTDLLAALWGGLGKRSECACFEPRYGVRVVRGSKTVDLVIGFTCEQMEIYDDRGTHQITVSASTQRAFNHILAEYDVPLPAP
jgi:hypothetical protein